MDIPTSKLELTDEERAVLHKFTSQGGRTFQERRLERLRARVLATWPNLPTAAVEERVCELLSGEMRQLAQRPRPSRRQPRRKNIKGTV